MDSLATSLIEMSWLLTWLPHGDDVATTWRWRGFHMALTWLSRGADMAATWRWRGCHVAMTWMPHGWRAALTWLPRGAHVAKFNTGIHKWWHHHIFSPRPITNIVPIILIEFSPFQDYNFNPWISFTKLNGTSITLKKLFILDYNKYKGFIKQELYLTSCSPTFFWN
jgi:hypothetical protein